MKIISSKLFLFKTSSFDFADKKRIEKAAVLDWVSETNATLCPKEARVISIDEGDMHAVGMIGLLSTRVFFNSCAPEYSLLPMSDDGVFYWSESNIDSNLIIYRKGLKAGWVDASQFKNLVDSFKGIEFKETSLLSRPDSRDPFVFRAELGTGFLAAFSLISFFLATIVSLFLFWGDLNEMKSIESKAAQENNKLYFEVFPGDRKIVNMKSQASFNLKVYDEKMRDSVFYKGLLIMKEVEAQGVVVKSLEYKDGVFSLDMDEKNYIKASRAGIDSKFPYLKILGGKP